MGSLLLLPLLPLLLLLLLLNSLLTHDIIFEYFFFSLFFLSFFPIFSFFVGFSNISFHNLIKTKIRIGHGVGNEWQFRPFSAGKLRSRHAKYNRDLYQPSN